jgi:hypothetical protein
VRIINITNNNNKNKRNKTKQNYASYFIINARDSHVAKANPHDLYLDDFVLLRHELNPERVQGGVFWRPFRRGVHSDRHCA